MPMKALILSCGTGGGHNEAGKAVCEALRLRGHEAVFFKDYLRLAGKRTDQVVCNLYVKSVSSFPPAFQAAYALGPGGQQPQPQPAHQVPCVLHERIGGQAPGGIFAKRRVRRGGHAPSFSCRDLYQAQKQRPAAAAHSSHWHGLHLYSLLGRDRLRLLRAAPRRLRRRL